VADRPIGAQPRTGDYAEEEPPPVDGALLAGTADLLPDESPEDLPDEPPDESPEDLLDDELPDESEVDVPAESADDELDELLPAPDPELPAGLDAALLPLPDPALLSVR